MMDFIKTVAGDVAKAVSASDMPAKVIETINTLVAGPMFVTRMNVALTDLNSHVKTGKIGIDPYFNIANGIKASTVVHVAVSYVEPDGKAVKVAVTYDDGKVEREIGTFTYANVS